jgi:3-oxoacyl-[acyl-carrier protein] reductase
MKTVLITGGSRGIGRACAELFAANGYNVAFTYKNSEKDAKSLAESINALAIRADSEVESDVIGAVKATLSEYGKIDCLINNAGISSFSLFTDLTLDEWQKTINVNLTGAFLYSRETVRSMISRKKGKIINITSMWGLVGSSCEVHYSASKAGLIGLTKALAKELGPSGITVNAIAPGVIDTDMNKALSEEDLKALEDETPLMRIGRAEEVARCALYLAGDAADFMTGEVINLSGGLVIT